jgi:alkylhydroperoxidase/carboxymuconolactone decarboxylase family protein YurZ
MISDRIEENLKAMTTAANVEMRYIDKATGKEIPQRTYYMQLDLNNIAYMIEGAARRGATLEEIAGKIKQGLDTAGIPVLVMKGLL